MTIIKPNEKKKSRATFVIVIALIMTSGVVYVAEYTRLAEARYAVRGLKNAITKEQAIRADLESEVFKRTNPAEMKFVAEEYGFVIDTRPQYLSLGR